MCPQDFADCLTECYERNAQGTQIKIHVEVVGAFWDFEEFLEPLPFALHGLTIQDS